MLRWILLISLLFLQTACDFPADKDRPNSPLLKSTEHTQEKGTAEEPVFEPLVATDLLNEPTQVYRFETTAEALSVWRRASEHPTLLLLSNNPHLTPVPEEFRKKTSILINNANAESLALKASDRSPSPLFLPGMAIDAALRDKWLKELAWALPLRDPAQELSLEKFTEQLLQSRIADEQESATLGITERVIHGTLRDTAFSAAALPLLQGLKGPVIVHIDLSYFQPIYKNEIATPLLDIVFNTLTNLKKMHLQTLAVTFSYGHLDSQIALDVRFLGNIIAYLIEDPARLNEPIPLNWQRQHDTLYLANFFQKEKIRELYEAQEMDAPKEAYIKFNLYSSAANHKEGTKALDYLAEAVTLDSMYALEYEKLSAMAYEKERPDEALRMLGLASEAFHTDPFLKLQRAQLANELGDKEQALELLNKTRNLNWSEHYYPQMPQYLTDLTEYVQLGEIPASTQPGASHESGHAADPPMEMVIPGKEAERSRTLHAN